MGAGGDGTGHRGGGGHTCTGKSIVSIALHCVMCYLCALSCGQCGEMVLALSSLLLPLGVPMDIRPFLTAEVG